MENAMDWSVWTPEDFGLDRKKNMLKAPRCDCGCGAKLELVLDEDEVIDYIANVLARVKSEWCAIIIIRPDKSALIVHRCENDIEAHELVMHSWQWFGDTVKEAEFDLWGVLLENGEYEDMKRYVILE